RLEGSLQIRDRGGHISDGLPAQSRGALSNVAGKNDHAVTGTWIIGLGIELPVRQSGHAIPQQIAEYVVVVVHADAGAHDGTSSLERVPGQAKLRSEIQVGLAH